MSKQPNVARPTTKTSESWKDQLDLRVAVLGAVAALLGALIGGASSYVVAVHSDTSKRADDRRTERRDAYAEYYADASALSNQIGLTSDELIAAKTKKPVDQAVVDKVEADIDDRTRLLGADQAKIVLLGSKEVSDSGFHLASMINALRAAIDAEPLVRADLQAKIDDTADALNDFAVAARSDLGI